MIKLAELEYDEQTLHRVGEKIIFGSAGTRWCTYLCHELTDDNFLLLFAEVFPEFRDIDQSVGRLMVQQERLEIGQDTLNVDLHSHLLYIEAPKVRLMMLALLDTLSEDEEFLQDLDAVRAEREAHAAAVLRQQNEGI